MTTVEDSTDEVEFCCNRYAFWWYVLSPRTPEMHADGCMPDAYVYEHDEVAKT